MIFLSILFTNLYIFLYGKFFNSLLYKKEYSKAEIGVLGCILVSFIALLINFFLPLNKFINTGISILPLLLLFKKNYLVKKDFLFLLISSFFVFILLAYAKINTPDAGLYHLPFTQTLNENKLIIGLSNVHSRFGHTSIIQYLNAINFNLITGVNGILIPVASLAVFIFLYFVNDLIVYIKNKDNLELNNLFSLFVIIYISYKINRYSGFGNDATAHLLFFYLISMFLKFNFSYKNLHKLSLISIYIIQNKITLMFSLFYPLFFFLFFKIKNLKILFSFPILFFLVWILKNVLTTGCIVYPIEKLCFKNLEWTNKEQIIEQNILGEAWSKGWPDRTNLEIEKKFFIKNFNWFEAWSSIHLKYILKIILPYIFFLILIILFINFYKTREFNKYKINRSIRIKLIFLISTLFISNIFFLYKFPLYRYGYSYIISIIILLSTLFIFKYNKIIIKKIFIFLLILCLTIYVAKQISRVLNSKTNNIWPNIYSFGVKKNEQIPVEKISIGTFKIYFKDKECMYNEKNLSPCTHSYEKNIILKKKYGYNAVTIQK